MADLTDLELLELAFTDDTGETSEELKRRGYELVNGEWD